MSNKITDKLLLREYARHSGSLQTFIRDRLKFHKGATAPVTAELAELVRHRDGARQTVCSAFVSTIKEEMRATLAQPTRPFRPSKALQKWDQEQRNKKLRAKAHDTIADHLYRLDEGYLRTLERDPEAYIKSLLSPEVLKIWDGDDWLEARQGLRVVISSKARQRQAEDEHKKLEAQAEKAKAFDRMVLALDAIQVGQKLLGDCTGADLLREAARLESMANEMTAQSVFYRQLADIVGKTTTVRTASDRSGIVALIGSRFKEAA